VLANDIDYDDDTLTITTVTQPEFGSVSFDGDFVYYTPVENYIGMDQFEYKITDGNNGVDTAVVVIDVYPINHPPEAPLIIGPPTGVPGVDYSFSFLSVDPDDNDLYYEILWGDGNFEDWIGPYGSNEAVSANHTWAEQGIFIIMARAKDTHNAVSDWTELDIWIPKNKAFTNTIIYRLLARFTELFTLLRNFQKLWQRYLFI
jgi:hypothetical protein